MSRITVLYNPRSGNGRGAKAVEAVKKYYPDDELEFYDVVKDNQQEVVNKAGDGMILLCGGDGTLNHFVNDVDTDNIKTDVYFYPSGSGNDFLNDIGRKVEEGPFKINEYIVNLPVITVKGKTYKFINGIGYGIDGYVCEEGDKIRATSTKRVNYTAIALKGLVYDYEPTEAKITVDGVTKEYKKVWLAPAMNGRYFGGGMMPTPDQKRLEKDKKLSCLVFHDAGKVKTLLTFPRIFKGSHVKCVKNAEIRRGKHIRVEFNRAVALQIDGETITGVTSYEAHVLN